MKRVEAGLRNITKNPLEAIGYVLAGSLVLTALYLFSPFYLGQAAGVTHYYVGIFYLVTGLPFLLRDIGRVKRIARRWGTNLVFVGHTFTTLFILISVGLRPLYWVWAAVCAITALVVHVWVVKNDSRD